jgi:SAM-dependent methyltransferase
MGHALRARVAAVRAALGPGAGDVLDAGMGGGRLCETLTAEGWTISGVDPAPTMVALARTRLPDASSRLLQGTIEQLPFADATFDAAVATGSLEYSSVRDAVAELARVVKPGGRLVVTYPNPFAFYAIWKTRFFYPVVRAAKRLARAPHPDLPRGFGVIPRRRFVALLREHGFETEAVTYTSYAPLLTPFDTLAPRLSERLGRAFEARSVAPTLFSTQIVYAARKDAA